MTRVCKVCHERPAQFRHRGQIKADDDHDVCLRCWRSWQDATRQGVTRWKPGRKFDWTGAQHEQ